MCCKVKGIILNYKNSLDINFDIIKKMINIIKYGLLLFKMIIKLFEILILLKLLLGKKVKIINLFLIKEFYKKI